jgi:acetoacetate decarboxylase
MAPLRRVGVRFVLEEGELEEVLGRSLQTRATFFDAEVAMVFFRTEAGVVERILPPPLSPPPEPLAMAFVARYPRTNFGSVYNEAALALVAEHRGELGGYILTMPVTEDMACILGREIFGFPKKIADEISLQRTEGEVRGRYVRRGRELLSLRLPFEEEVEGRELLERLGSLGTRTRGEGWEAVSYNFKFFLSPELSGFDYRPRLVRQVTLFRPLGRVRLSYRFDLTLRSSETDPLGEVPVVEPLFGFYGTFQNTMEAGEVVAEVEESDFMRYAFFKLDHLPG